jgi:hypothetical protein
MYRYFIAYIHNDGVGNGFINRTEPITEDAHIKEIQQQALQANPNVLWVSINNFMLISQD